ncbi:hypothetical protein CDD83_10787 [Cordyceps sp. RAO-2017]|nr:hypothetical protein CDD83_10787 [Cordyceps sp. RAO-2017]
MVCQKRRAGRWRQTVARRPEGIVRSRAHGASRGTQSWQDTSLFINPRRRKEKNDWGVPALPLPLPGSGPSEGGRTKVERAKVLPVAAPRPSAEGVPGTPLYKDVRGSGGRSEMRSVKRRRADGWMSSKTLAARHWRSRAPRTGRGRQGSRDASPPAHYPLPMGLDLPYLYRLQSIKGPLVPSALLPAHGRAFLCWILASTLTKLSSTSSPPILLSPISRASFLRSRGSGRASKAAKHSRTAEHLASSISPRLDPAPLP